MFRTVKLVGVGGDNGARSQGPVGACRFTRSDEGEDVEVRRGVVRSVFSSILTRQGNTGEETDAGKIHRQAEQ